MSLGCKLWHLIVNGDCISLFIDRKTLSMKLYVSMYMYERNAPTVCCCHRRRATLTSHQPHFADANKHQKRQQGHIHNSWENQLDVCFRTQVFFSFSFVLSLKCWQSMKQNANSLLSLIPTHIYSIICTVSRIKTDMHLKHSSEKKNDYYYVTLVFLCMISFMKLLFFAYQSFI